jgi:hypothetical protein
MPRGGTVHRLLGSLATSLPLRLGVFLGLSLIAGFAALGQVSGMNSFHDAQFLAAYEQHARIAVMRHHELPLWDPYNCGGLYGLAAPQTRYASPFFLLTLLFGVERGAALAFVLLPALGMEGLFRYAQRWGARAVPALLVAPAFGLCGWFAHAFQFGWVQFLSFALVPFVLLGVRGALRGSRTAAFGGALAVAITIGFGGTYTLPMAMIPCAFELFDAALPPLAIVRRQGLRAYAQAIGLRMRRLVPGLATLSVLCLGIGAYRLWPMLESVEATLRVMGGEPKHALHQLQKLLFVAADEKSETLGHFYFAPALAALALLSPWRGKRALWASALLLLALSTGHQHPLAPFSLLRHLPIYETLRYPERYLSLFVIAGSVLASLGATRMLAYARRARPSRLAWLALPILLIACAFGVSGAMRNVGYLLGRVHLVPAPEVRDAPFRQSRGNRWMMKHFAAEGLGSLGCGEAYPLPMSTRLRGDLKAEEYLVGRDDAPADGSAERIAWSPNALTVQVESRQPVRLAVNQNYHPGWRSSVGKVTSWDGLLSVELPAGAHRVTLRFVPRSGIGGLIASLCALIGGAIYVWRRPRARWARLLAVGIGPLLVALLLVLWPEAPWRQPAPLTDAGEPVLLTELPSEARPVRVQFDVPFALVGVQLPREPLPVDARELPLSLFFERTGKMSASIGLFLHLFGPEDRQERGDHTSVSGRVYFSRLPIGQIGRDTLVVPLPENARGEWEVRLGLWNIHGDGGRRKIARADVPVDTEAAIVGRVRVGPPAEPTTPGQ